MAQGEFIDLYELLQMPVEADAATIRKQIGQLYLEAQSNLDHRNPQKKLQYQQMYEVYLPQARHLLLDPSRRAEYDRYLTAYRSGKPISQVEQKPVGAKASSAAVEVPEMSQAEEKIDPAVLAAQREQLWNKWKSGLDFGEPEASGTAASTSQAGTAAGTATVTLQVPAISDGAYQRNGSQAATRQSTHGTQPHKRPASHDLATEEAEKQQKLEFERHREAHRDEMVQNLAQTSVLIWTFGSGVAALFGISILLLLTDTLLQSAGKYPFLGMQRGTFSAVGFGIAVLGAIIAAFIGSGTGRERTMAQLSSLSYEELQRRTQ